MVFSTTFSMPSFLSTTVTMARLAIAISIQGTHQLALRRMSVNVLLGATKVSTTRSAWERGACSRGATELTELMGLLLVQTKVQGPGYAKAGNESASDQTRIRRDCTTGKANGCAKKLRPTTLRLNRVQSRS